MINLLKKGVQKLNEELAQYEQLRVNAENEYQAMSCGAFDQRLLARLKEVNLITTRTTARTKKYE